MNATIEIWVPGIPKGQPRVKARAVTAGGRTFARVYTPAAAAGFKDRINAAALPHRPAQTIVGPVFMSIGATFPRPAKHYRKVKGVPVLRDDAPDLYIGKPDRDNLDKAVMDALTVLGFWRDDAQVCGGQIEKRYADTPEQIGCRVVITEMQP